MKFLNRTYFKILYLAIILILLYSPRCFPQKMDVPVRIQAATFSKIFKYDLQLRQKNPVRLLIVFDKHSTILKEQLIGSFKKSMIEVATARPNQIARAIESADVVYFMPGLAESAAICKQKKKLSISGESRHAQNGDISIALGLVNDRPRLFVNMASLKGEGHQLSADLLKISKVYK